MKAANIITVNGNDVVNAMFRVGLHGDRSSNIIKFFQFGLLYIREPRWSSCSTRSCIFIDARTFLIVLYCIKFPKAPICDLSYMLWAFQTALAAFLTAFLWVGIVSVFTSLSHITAHFFSIGGLPFRNTCIVAIFATRLNPAIFTGVKPFKRFFNMANRTLFHVRLPVFGTVVFWSGKPGLASPGAFGSVPGIVL